MAAKSARPRVEWAFFCAEAKRDSGNFINATRVLYTIPAISNPNIGINFALVFGLDGEPSSSHTLTLRLVRPNGQAKTFDQLDIRFGANGFLDGLAALKDMAIAEPGDLRMEFRFNGETVPTHVATVRVLDAHPEIQVMSTSADIPDTGTWR